MAEKDILEKVLMSHADVFADCINALMYEGRKKLKKENLRPAPTESFYRGKRRLRNQFCDRSFYDVRQGEIGAQYIVENETELRRRQVLRKASYQGGFYREQLEGRKPVYPVIGMVLDWTGKTSRIPLTLHNLLRKNGVPQDVLRLVDNVELRIFHMKNLSADVRRRFTSDLGFVADYLNEGNFEKRKQQKIVHVDALCEMMTALTEDTRFMEQAEALLERQREKEEVHMCEYIDMLEARGQARGEAIGEARGQAKGEKRLGRLIQLLLKEKRYNEIERVSGNRRRRQELYRQYGI